MVATEKKKVVKSASEGSSSSTNAGGAKRPKWEATPEAKKKALTFRIIAAVLWALAISGEAYAIFGVLAHAPVNMTLLIILIVAIGILAIAGNLLWRKANQLDPASEKNKVAFWIQNQLGAIITMIAFLPLIVLILVNKDMDPKQKTIATVIAALVAIPAIYTGVELNSNSVEQMDAEYGYIQALTGDNHVYWTKSGGVYHLCSAADYVNRASQDNTIYEGTIERANEEGKRAPSDQTIRTQANQCGFEYFTMDEYKETLLQGGSDDADQTGDDVTDEDAPVDDEGDDSEG